MVMGGDSCSKGCEFESQDRVLDEHFSHGFVLKIVMFAFERLKINEKRLTTQHWLASSLSG